jgi:hypothetical protein
MNTVWRALCFRSVWIAFALVAAVACAAPTPPAPPPRQIVNQAAQKLVNTQSLHFIIEFSGSPTYLDRSRTLALRRVEGDLARPDRMRASVKAALPGAYILIQAIGIGDQQFATNPLNGQWQKIPPEWGFNPALLFQHDTGLTALLADVQNLAALADETIENQRHYHLGGQIVGAKIAPLTGWLVGAGAVDFELWVGVSDAYARRIRLIDRSSASNAPGATPSPPAQWNMELSQFDAPVKIEPPQF